MFGLAISAASTDAAAGHRPNVLRHPAAEHMFSAHRWFDGGRKRGRGLRALRGGEGEGRFSKCYTFEKLSVGTLTPFFLLLA